MRRQLLFHGKSMPVSPKLKEKWITVNGTHVKLDEEGNIEKGPEGLKDDFGISSDFQVPYFLKEHEEIISKFSLEEKESIKKYTAHGFRSLNPAMRKCPPDFQCLSDDNKKMLNALESAITKAGKFPEPIGIYRGIGLDVKEDFDSFMDEAKKSKESGNSFQIPSVVSTTLDADRGAIFGSSYSNHILFSIKAKTGLYIESISEKSGENEIIQSPKTKYRVLNIKNDVDFLDSVGNQSKLDNVIYLEEV